MNKNNILPLALAAILLATSWVSMPFLEAVPAQAQSSTTINVIGGEVNATIFGFGLAGQNLTSPGPTIVVQQGDTVTINFTNIGGPFNQPHTFTILLDSSGNIYATVGTVSNPINVGQSGTTTFKADTPGNFTYICAVPGHKDLGMWGAFVVKPSN